MQLDEPQYGGLVRLFHAPLKGPGVIVGREHKFCETCPPISMIMLTEIYDL